MSFVVDGLFEIDRTFNNIKKGLVSRELNLARGEEFKTFTRRGVRAGRVSILKIKAATVKIHGKYHQPEWFRGNLLKAMRVKGQKDGSAEAGYFSGDPTKLPGSKLTTYQIALLQHTGFRIPLKGIKGGRVRKFLAAHGIFPRKDKEFLRVHPRPFLFMSEIDYRGTNNDFNTANRFLKDMMSKL